jgi:fumarate reductase flavoprotein subunit
VTAVLPRPDRAWDAEVDTLIVGGGAAGMAAALASLEAGRTPLVVEGDRAPRGSTALSAGLIPAAGTRHQAAAGIADDAATFAADIQAKCGGEADPAVVAALTEQAAATIHWLEDRHGLPFTLVDDFDYPGHSRRRMHGLPTRSGGELIDRLRSAAEAAGVDILCERRATTLFVEAGGAVTGALARRPDGGEELIACRRLVLACNGFGGDRDRVARHIPPIAGALYFGHDGNRGEALAWGEALGAATRHLGAYQGHGNVAHPHGVLITWAVISAGGVQVNAEGVRFWDESVGYSEAAEAVLAQPGGVAVTVFDEAAAAIARQFQDFRDAEAQGAVKAAATPAALAAAFGLPADALARTIAEAARHAATGGVDRFGRSFAGARPLAPPSRAVRVTGALFHTQGGLAIDARARVQRKGGGAFPNLYAVGGAACGVSGSGASGYLSGNGLLAAAVLGRIAGAD